jgi:hypothetical protein
MARSRKGRPYISALNVATCLLFMTMASLEKIWSLFDTSTGGDFLIVTKTSAGTRGGSRNLMAESGNADGYNGRMPDLDSSDTEYIEVVTEEDIPVAGSGDEESVQSVPDSSPESTSVVNNYIHESLDNEEKRPNLTGSMEEENSSEAEENSSEAPIGSPDPETKESSKKEPSQPKEAGVDEEVPLGASSASALPPDFATKHRIITLVHVGKAGGSTIRNNLAPKECKDMHTWDNPKTKKEIWLKERCLHFEEIGQKLSLQTRNVFHLWGYNETAVKESTSFIVTLRNPVDRIISGKHSSHTRVEIKSDPKRLI